MITMLILVISFKKSPIVDKHNRVDIGSEMAGENTTIPFELVEIDQDPNAHMPGKENYIPDKVARVAGRYDRGPWGRLRRWAAASWTLWSCSTRLALARYLSK